MGNPFERGPERDPHEKVPCPNCGGSGKVKKGEKYETCQRCDGKGWYLSRK
jgi:DnaJ-class molecular chaperone